MHKAVSQTNHSPPCEQPDVNSQLRLDVRDTQSLGRPTHLLLLCCAPDSHIDALQTQPEDP
jgi:hypothetical protein